MTELALPLDVAVVGEVITWRFDLGFLPPSKNVYDSWPGTWKSSAKGKWIKHIGEQCDRLQVPYGLARVGLAARLTFPTNQRRDPQNYSNCLWHWVPDALVRCGRLVDDRDGALSIGPNWGITFAVDNRPHVNKRLRQRTTITMAARLHGAALDLVREG